MSNPCYSQFITPLESHRYLTKDIFTGETFIATLNPNDILQVQDWVAMSDELVKIGARIIVAKEVRSIGRKVEIYQHEVKALQNQDLKLIDVLYG